MVLTKFVSYAKMVIMFIERYLSKYIKELSFSSKKMAFLSGPRQSGKTTLGKGLVKERLQAAYYSWDDINFRRLWVKDPSQFWKSFNADGQKENPLLILDELHKAKGWKGTLKGLYDTLTFPVDIMVTGSARLNVYMRGGDSLMGRYFHFRLHPLSLGEVLGNPGENPDKVIAASFSHNTPNNSKSTPQTKEKTYAQLYDFGGFPEPFLRQSKQFSRLWRQGRIEKIVREDLRDLSRLPELSQVEMLVSLLPERAGGLLSVQSLREDLEVAHDTVRRWMNYLKELYYHFEIRPFTRSVKRSLKKEPKLFLWDWSEVEEKGARFENLVACHLLKASHFWTDIGEGSFDLFYLRDKEKNEVDFLVTRDRKPLLVVEAKYSDTAINPALVKFAYDIGCTHRVQVLHTPGIRKKVKFPGKPDVLLVSACDFLSFLP
jgi:uncharacterized protein